MIYTPFIWPQIFTLAIAVGIAIYIRRLRDAPVIQHFGVLVWVVALWTLLYTLNISTVDFSAKLILYHLQPLVLVMLPPVALVVALEYTGRDQWVSRRYLALLLSVPVVSMILTITSPYHQLFRYDFRLDSSGAVPVILSSKGPFYWVDVGYSVFLILLACMILLVSFRLRTIYFRNALILVIALLTPMLSDLLYEFNLSPVPGYNWTASLFAISGILFLWAITSFRIFDVTPVARNTLVDNIADLVIVTDTGNHIVDFNKAAQKQIGLSQKSAGLASEALPPEWAELFRRYLHVTECKEEIAVESNSEQSFYELTISPILDHRCRKLGRLFLLRDISRRKQAEQARRETETRYQTLVELLPDGVVIHRAGKIVFANPACASMIGAERAEDMVGRNVLDFIHPDSLPTVVERQQKLFQEQEALPLTNEKFIRLDGSTIEVEVTSRRLEVGREVLGLTVFHDISLRKQAQEKLLQLSLAVEQSPASIVITDPSGAIEYANPKFTEITGYTLEDAIGQNPSILKGGTPPPGFYHTLWETITAGSEWRGEFLNRKKTGELFWESASISPIIDPFGKITHYVAVKEDITERKQTEAAMKQYAVELQERNQELDAFSHTVAHDLKEPISVIAGYTDLILDEINELPPAQVQSLLRKVRQNTDRLNRIISELMLLAGVRKQQIIPEPLRMSAILEEVLERLTILITRSQAQITILGKQGARDWPQALGYAPWVEEIWTNYISNAIHYGGTPPIIELGALRQENERVRFFVRDNGQGLSETEQKRLFTPFTQFNQARISGHGLGLSIVRSIAEKLNGEVGVESQPGKGSLFYFVLPVSIAASTAAAPTSTPALPPVSLKGMPAEWLQNLLKAAQAGDWQEIHQLSDQVRDDWPDIAFTLNGLTDSFDYRTIILMIQRA